MTIDALPNAPAVNDAVDVFDAKAFAWVAALQQFVSQANTLGLEVQNNADITAALALSMALPNYGGTSTSSLTIGTGTKTLVTQPGKSWVPGQVVVVSNGAGAYMKGTVAAYAASTLDVNVTAVVGSGSFSSWTIGLSYTALGLQPRAQRIDVASVAGTVDLTAAAPDSDDIRITGSLAITAFTVAANRVFRVTAGGAFTLVNNASIVTQKAASIVAAPGDTFMLRATNNNVVEVLNYTCFGIVPDAFITAIKIAAATITPEKLSGAQSGSAPALVARAMCVFNGTISGTNAPTYGKNVANVTRNGVGDYTVNFSTPMSDANYAVIGSCGNADTSVSIFQSAYAATQTASACRVFTQGGFSGVDRTWVSVVVFK